MPKREPQVEAQPLEIPPPPWQKQLEGGGDVDLDSLRTPAKPEQLPRGIDALKLKEAEPYDPPAPDPKIYGPIIGRPIAMDRLVPPPADWRAEEREYLAREREEKCVPSSPPSGRCSTGTGWPSSEGTS